MSQNYNPNDPNAMPDFDEWGPDSYWSQADWATWLGTLVEEFGPVGVDMFYQAWSSRLGFWSTLGDVRNNWITLDTGFRNQMSKYTLTNGTNLLEALEGTIFLGGIMGGGSDAVNNVGDTLSSTTKTFSWLVPALLIAAGVIALYLLFKFNPLKKAVA